MTQDKEIKEWYKDFDIYLSIDVKLLPMELEVSIEQKVAYERAEAVARYHAKMLAGYGMKTT